MSFHGFMVKSNYTCRIIRNYLSNCQSKVLGIEKLKSLVAQVVCKMCRLVHSIEVGRWSKLGKICSTQLLNDPFFEKVKRKYRFPSQKTFTLQVYLQSARVPRIIKDFYTNLVLKKAAENQTICPEKISRLESDGISHQNKRIFGIFNRKKNMPVLPTILVHQLQWSWHSMAEPI